MEGLEGRHLGKEACLGEGRKLGGGPGVRGDGDSRVWGGGDGRHMRDLGRNRVCEHGFDMDCWRDSGLFLRTMFREQGCDATYPETGHHVGVEGGDEEREGEREE